MVGRTPDAARQLASRARRRVWGADLRAPEPDLARQREVVDAFFAAARGGDFDALVALLDPDVVLRVDCGPGRRGSMVVRGAELSPGKRARSPGRRCGRPWSTARLERSSWSRDNRSLV